MSFSSNVKQELCRLPINRKMEAAAELYGIYSIAMRLHLSLSALQRNPAIWQNACRVS